MRVLLYNVTSRGKITSFDGKDMPVSFAFPFGGAEKKNSKDEESNESRRTVGSTTSATENHRGEQQQETVGLAFGKIWECYSPRFQLTRYYRYGEMDNCEEFWEDFYKSIENHTGKPLPTRRSKSGSKSENDIKDIETKKKKKGQFLSSLKTKCEHFLTKTKENEEENTREEAREARAFAQAWQVMDPNEAEVSWRKRYRDLLEKPEEKESGGVSVHNNNEDKDEESPR
ncbi:unnamed protein product [Bathycoccus prasinos]